MGAGNLKFWIRSHTEDLHRQCQFLLPDHAYACCIAYLVMKEVVF